MDIEYGYQPARLVMLGEPGMFLPNPSIHHGLDVTES